jgi:tRNA1Val (adenine37-N6)-methyltransferase
MAPTPHPMRAARHKQAPSWPQVLLSSRRRLHPTCHATAATPLAEGSSTSRRKRRAADTPEQRARRARPATWAAPGPPPAAAHDPELASRPLGQGETLSYLSGDWRILQLADGHRWSVDDHVTALVALQEAGGVAAAAAASGGGRFRCLDLGCGIGSVLLMVAWDLRRRQQQQQEQQQEQQQQRQHQTALRSPPPPPLHVGVEAQAVSAALARRSAEHNLGRGQTDVVILSGDLRDSDVRQQALLLQAAEAGGGSESGFDLITGTPPYIPPGTGLESARPQKGACCVETRGGVEEYCQAAAELLAPGGVFVCCAGVTPDAARGRRAVVAAGLRVARRVVVVPRRGKPPLFEVVVARRRRGEEQEEEEGEGEGEMVEEETFVVRESDGSLGEDMVAARAAMGFPPPPAAATATAAAAG